MSHGHHAHHSHSHGHHAHGGHSTHGHQSHEPPQHGLIFRFWRAVIVLMIVGLACWIVVPVVDGFVYAAWMQIHDGRSLYLETNNDSHWTPPSDGLPDVPSGE